jgi:hypothetical protein
MDDMAPIFISYRRSDAAGHARALHEYLSGRFGVDRIFFDRSMIEAAMSSLIPSMRASKGGPHCSR